MPKIVFKDVDVIYRSKKSEKVVFDHFNEEFLPDKTSVIVGFSGCGKSTLLRTLFDGVDYNGLITIDDKNIEDINIQDRELAYVSQEYVLYPHMTIFDNIAFPLRNMKAPSEEIKERVYAIAEELDLSMCLSRKPRHLSGGQQQRVALARALVKNPSICLLDEPLSNLDQATAFKAREIMKRCLNKRKVTVLYATHNISEATSLGDYIYAMDEGKIIFKGTPEEFMECKDEKVTSLIDGR